MSKIPQFALGALLALGLLCAGQAAAQSAPTLSISVDGGQTQEFGLTIQIVALMTLLTLAPAILMLTTSFTRILIVLGFLRQAIGTPQMPNNQILVGLSLFLSTIIMMPVGEAIHRDAIVPYMAEDPSQRITQKEALTRAIAPMRRFMLANVREKDLALFFELSRKVIPEDPAETPMSVVVPAFLTSELKTAFTMGFLLYIPFLLVDMVVASVLMSMGMMMLPPVLISLPFKILLFVMVDGWHLITRTLVTAFVVSA